MRVAIFVLGIAFTVGGAVNVAAADTKVSPASQRAVAALADGVIAAPIAAHLRADQFSAPAVMLASQDGLRNGTMGYTPSQSPGSFSRGTFAEFAPASFGQQRFDSWRSESPDPSSLSDHFLTGFVAIMLIAYQLRRKHRFLRPHQFST